MAPPDWRGRRVVCIASGPSLTVKDCDLVRASGLPAVVVNTSVLAAPWADVLFAWDTKWWGWFADERRDDLAAFSGRKMCASVGPGATRAGAENVLDQSWFVRYPNSGAAAVVVAIAGGASDVAMLGFDCQLTGGKAHWHGDHPAKLSNCRTVDDWPKTFRKLAGWASTHSRVVNVSRETRLTHFPRQRLEDWL